MGSLQEPQDGSNMLSGAPRSDVVAILASKTSCGTSKIIEILRTVCNFCDFAILSTSRLRSSILGPSWAPPKATFGLRSGPLELPKRFQDGFKTVQDASKMAPMPSKIAPKVIENPPKRLPRACDPPRSAHEVPKSSPRALMNPPRALQGPPNDRLQALSWEFLG